MKKILFTAVSAFALASFADGVASTEFGAMKVPVSATERQTIVSVPWLESGTGETAVSVSNLVLTAGLEEGDLLNYYNGTGYDQWMLMEDATTHARYWQSVKQDQGNNTYQMSTPPDVTGLPRGGAVILDRCGEPSLAEREVKTYFYIMGKPFSGTEDFVNLTGGTRQSPVYSLIAPPSVAPVDVNTGMSWQGIHTWDSIIMPDGSSLVWDNGSWWKRVNNVWTDQGIVIPMGTGVWFLSKDNKSEKKFKLGK